jgi:hypothetical protein
MKSPSRAAARPGWIGRQPPAKARECPRCPAKSYVRCMRWVKESWKENGVLVYGEGRWELMRSYHPVRTGPGGVNTEDFMQADHIQCERQEQHGYHWVTEGVVWCRGRAR